MAISRKKNAHNSMCGGSNEENNDMYEISFNAMREKAEEVLTKLNNCANGMLTLVR